MKRSMPRDKIFNANHFQNIRMGVEHWNQFVANEKVKNPDWRPELEGANLQGANLSGFDLGRAFLRSAKLTNSQLIDANLEAANLSLAIAIDATFQGANLFNANLSMIELISSDLSNANLSESNLASAILVNSIFTNTNFERALLTNADFANSDLNNAIFIAADLGNAFLYNASLVNTNLTKADLQGAMSKGMKLENVDFTDADVTRIDFGEYDLSKVDISKADIEGAQFSPQQVKAIRRQRTSPQTNSNPWSQPDKVFEASTASGSNGSSDKHFWRNLFKLQNTLNTTLLDLSGDQNLFLQALSINLAGKHNQVSSNFDEIMGLVLSAPNISEVRHLSQDATNELIQILATNPMGAAAFSSGAGITEPVETIAAAIADAMGNNYAIPYYGSMDWLSPENIEKIKEAYTFVIENGPDRVQGASLTIGKSLVIVVLLGSFALASGKIVLALGDKAVQIIENYEPDEAQPTKPASSEANRIIEGQLKI